MQFGRSSEKLNRQIEQLELRLESWNRTERSKRKRGRWRGKRWCRSVRRPLPAHLRREVQTHLPQQKACPDCGGELTHLGEDVSEILEYVPERFKVIRHVRLKLACACCDRIVQAAAPSRPIERGVAGPGLLAHVLVSKYGDHLPLYRQSEIYAREGVELDRSTLADWVGGTSRLLAPGGSAATSRASGQKLHADDTPVPVLAPGLGKTKTGRLWTYVRDDRPAGDRTPPAVWFAYSADRKGEHPKQHLSSFRGRCRPMVTQGSIRSTRRGASRKQLAGRMCEGSFTISCRLTSRGRSRSAGTDRELYAIEKEIRGRHLKSGARSATCAAGRCWYR